MTTQLIDIGANLIHRYFNLDRKEVIQRAIDAGVSTIIITGSNVKSSQAAQRLASYYPGKLYVTAGVHPHDSRNSNDATINMLRNLASSKEIVAIGECGLDYNRDFSPRLIQNKWFEAQIE
ncbi:MAG: TatD DNase family protein, partial [bacterium]